MGENKKYSVMIHTEVQDGLTLTTLEIRYMCLHLASTGYRWNTRFEFQYPSQTSSMGMNPGKNSTFIVKFHATV